MLIIQVENDNIEKALRKFKAKTKRTKLLIELSRRQAYVKPSVKHRQKHKKAAYVNKKFNQTNDD